MQERLNLDSKPMTQVLEECIEYQKKVLDFMLPASVNLELLQGDISHYQEKKRVLIDDNKKLEVRNANLKQEIEEKLKKADEKAEAIIEKAKVKEVELIKLYAEKEKELQSKYDKSFMEHRKVAVA